MDQNNLLGSMVEFNNNTRPKKMDGKEKTNTFDSVSGPYEGWGWTLNAFESGIFRTKGTKVEGLKKLTPKQMLQDYQ